MKQAPPFPVQDRQPSPFLVPLSHRTVQHLPHKPSFAGCHSLCLQSAVEGWVRSVVEGWVRSAVEGWVRSTVEGWVRSTVEGWVRSTVEGWVRSTDEGW